MDIVNISCQYVIAPGTENSSEFDDILSKRNPNIKYKAASDLAIFGMVENNLGISKY